MDRAIVYTANPAQHPLKIRPKKLPKHQKIANQFVDTPVTSISEMSGLRNFLFRSQHRPDELGDPKILDLFGDAVKSRLTAKNVPNILRRIQLFVFLSYTAVVEKRLIELRSTNETLRRNKEKERKALENSIKEQNLNVQKDAEALKKIYKAVEELKTAIAKLVKTIQSLDIAIEKLNTAMDKALEGSLNHLKSESTPRDYLKRMRTGALYLHQVIAGLVDAKWAPVDATRSVISRTPLAPWRYLNISSNCVQPMVTGLMNKGFADLAPRHSDISGSNSEICIAEELAELNSSLELQQTHQDLGYDFGCRVNSPCITSSVRYPEIIDTGSAIEQSHEVDSASETAGPRQERQPLFSHRVSIGMLLNAERTKSDVTMCETQSTEHSAERPHPSQQIQHWTGNPKKRRFESTLGPYGKTLQSRHIASVPSKPRNLNFFSTALAMQRRQSGAPEHTDHAIHERLSASTQSSDEIQLHSNKTVERLQIERQSEQSENRVCYRAQHSTVRTDARCASDHIIFTSIPRPQLLLRIPNKVPDTAQSVWFATSGNVTGLKFLFSQGLASPWDVSISRGYTLVRWALYGGMCNFETVQFLLNQGALVDEESYQHVWDYAYRERCSIAELHELRCITLNPPPSYACTDWVEEQQFSPIHTAVFRRSSESLSTLLADDPDAVHLTDATGRTALDWATALGRLSDMRILIDYGSPLNTMDISGRTTVLHAVDSHSVDALRIVLEAGADPNPKVPEGLFRSSPLTAASFGGLVEMMNLLLEFRAEVDASNPEGRTALHTVARMGGIECADILLNYHANMFYVSKNGLSPFTTAIVYNNHAVLTLFIDRGDASGLKDIQLPPFIFGSAGAKTMSILAASELVKQNTNKDDPVAGRKILSSSMDYEI